MTEQEIKDQWFPICQPGCLVKRTIKSNGSVTFFYVLGEPKFKKATLDIGGIEVFGVEIGRPNGIFQDRLLDYRQEKPHTIFCRDDWNTLEPSTLDEMLKHYEELYEREIREMYDHIRLIKKHIQAFRRTQKTLNSTIRQRYDYAVSGCLATVEKCDNPKDTADVNK